MTETRANLYTPADFSLDYTQYYQRRTSDSPPEARKELSNRLLQLIVEKLSTQDSVAILDLGAGRQILEAELAASPHFSALRNKVKIFTLDIADLHKKQLLTSHFQHLRANGAELPFADNTFDIIFSCMAIDFMPRNQTFSEVSRVLKTNADVLINFHHPNLIRITESNYHDLLVRKRAINKKLRCGGTESRKFYEKIDKIKYVEIEIRDAEFVLNQFPHHIFHSVEEIALFLEKFFSLSNIRINENIALGKNGWFSAVIRRGLGANTI